jgi:hypothetical protein
MYTSFLIFSLTRSFTVFGPRGLSDSPDSTLFGVLQNSSEHLDSYRKVGLNCAILEVEWT